MINHLQIIINTTSEKEDISSQYSKGTIGECIDNEYTNFDNWRISRKAHFYIIIYK